MSTVHIPESEMPGSIEEKYYFLMGMIEGALEVGVLYNDSPLLDAIIQMLEGTELSEEEESMLEKFRYLKSLPIPSPF